MLEKQKRWRSKRYLNWIVADGQRCVICGHEGWEENQLIAHHAISVPGLNLGATGSKASDSYAMPMHVTCHMDFHQHPYRYREEQRIWLINTMAKAIQTFA